jgi:hypothetical protein
MLKEVEAIANAVDEVSRPFKETMAKLRSFSDKVRNKLASLIFSEQNLEKYAGEIESRLVNSFFKCEAEHIAENAGKTILHEGIKTSSTGWNISETGSMINGRYYTKHALERMAPATKEVIEELEKRALACGYQRGGKEFTKYIQPRNIPPMVVEDAVQNGVKTIGSGKNIGTICYETEYMRVILNNSGDVVSVYRIG